MNDENKGKKVMLLVTIITIIISIIEGFILAALTCSLKGVGKK